MIFNELDKQYYYKRRHWDEGTYVIAYRKKTDDWHYIDQDGIFSDKGIGITVREATNFVQCNKKGVPIIAEPDVTGVNYRKDFLLVKVVFDRNALYDDKTKVYTYCIGGKKELRTGTQVVVEGKGGHDAVAYVHSYHDRNFDPAYDCRWVVGTIRDNRAVPKQRSDGNLPIQSIIADLVTPKED